MRTKIKPKSMSKDVEEDKLLVRNTNNQDTADCDDMLVEDNEEPQVALKAGGETVSDVEDEEEYLEDSDSSLWALENELLLVENASTKSSCNIALVDMHDHDFTTHKRGIKKERTEFKDEPEWEYLEDDESLEYDCVSEDEELFKQMKQRFYKVPNKYIKRRPKPGGYCCNYCSLKFDKLKLLSEHTKSRHSDVYLTCVECNKTLKSLKNLRQHRILHINKGKQFCCDICGAAFIEKRRLNLHKIIHSEIKPIKCQVCNKTFSHRSNYSRHYLVHSGSRPFKCECGRDFSNSTKLKKHRKIHIPSE